MEVYIYGLIDPRFNIIRYINKSINPRNRIKDFTNENKLRSVNSLRNDWLLELMDNNLRPVLAIIEKCALDNWIDRERHWINYYLAMPVSLITDENQKRLIRNIDSRIKSSASNQGKVNKTKINTSGFVGVSRKANGKWYTRINYLGETIPLGRFDNQIDAAVAYNQKALELYGDKARLNPI